MIMGPRNLNRRLCNIIMVPCYVVMGLCNVIIGPRNVNRGS